MLCPETWNFEPLPHYTTILHLNVMKNANAIELVKSHYFNHSISMVLPDTVTVPQNLHNCLSKDTDYYRINKLHVNDLLNIEFIEAFVKKAHDPDPQHSRGLVVGRNTLDNANADDTVTFKLYNLKCI
ncbi:RPP40 protein, partial [Acromyrmex charruanus]